MTREALHSIALPDGEAKLRIRPSRRARRVSISVDAASGAVELVVPQRVGLRSALAFLDEHKAWVAARLAALPAHVAFADGAVVPVLGVPHVVRYLGEQRGAPVEIAEGEVRVRGDAAHLPRRIRDHLIALARRELQHRARAHAATLQRTVARISVRDTRSRWGSCAANGNLSFSWRLVLAPAAVLDYVVAHEVAHLAEMNHGPRFWRIVARLCPDWRHHRAWLSRNRSALLRFG